MTKILIAEDERIIAWNIQEVLQVTGHQVVSSVSTAEEAIAIASQQHPDLILMDIRLSGKLDGIAAAQEIYDSYGIPSIYLTAHADDYIVERAMETAPFGYVLKPFKRNDLLLAIKVAIKRHQREKQNQREQQSASLMLDHFGDEYLAEGIDYFLNAPSAEVNVESIDPNYDASRSTCEEDDSQGKLTLSKLTSLVRRSLDDKSIINNMVHDLGLRLGLRSCHVSIHPFKVSDTPAVIATFCQGMPDLTHFSLSDAVRTAVSSTLSFQQPIYFCITLPADRKSNHVTDEERLSVLIYPLLNQNGAVIGDIMVTRAVDSVWTSEEMDYVGSIADQCLVALRQSLLYQVVQHEMKTKSESKSRTPLSDQWVSSLSHELRTPIANIKMASQMLELVVDSLGAPDDKVQPTQEYFRILQYECERETRLVDAIVEANQDSTTQVLTFNIISLPDLMNDVVNAHAWQMQRKRQRLETYYSDDVLHCKTAPSILKRVLNELLDYASRHSGPEGLIRLEMKHVSTDMPSPSQLSLVQSIDNERANGRHHDISLKTPVEGNLEILISHTNLHATASDISTGLTGFDTVDGGLRSNQYSTGLGLFLAKIQVEKLSGLLKIFDSDSFVVFSICLPDDPERQSLSLTQDPVTALAQ
ncbi:MAG: response regulator [Cyanobacteria bacterium J06627_8]